MEEHIKVLEHHLKHLPFGSVSERVTEPLKAAIALMHAAEPKDIAAEKEYCAQRAHDLWPTLQMCEFGKLLLSERAGRKGEGWASRQGEIDALKNLVEALHAQIAWQEDKIYKLQAERTGPQYFRELLDLADQATGLIETFRTDVKNTQGLPK